MKIVPLFIFILIFTAYSCNKKAVKTNDNSHFKLYQPLENTLRPIFTMYHSNDSISNINIYCNTSNIVFTADKQGTKIGKIWVSYRLINEKNILGSSSDSGSYLFQVDKSKIKDEVIFRIPIKCIYNNTYILHVIYADAGNSKRNHHFMQIDKQGIYSSSNYLLINPSTMNNLAKPYIQVNENFLLLYAKKQPDSLYVAYFEPHQPGYNQIDSQAKTLIHPVIYKDYKLPYNDSSILSLEKKGTYLFSVKPDLQKGKTINVVGSSFPRMSGIDEMSEALIYIMDSTAYRDMKENENPKKSFDRFWLSIYNNAEDKAKELIKIYYNRVELANYYFSDWQEGWKTDRGMVFILLGPPVSVMKANNEEKWMYKYSGKDQYFIFKRIDTQLSNEVYVLLRKSSDLPLLETAKKNWAKGIIIHTNK